MKSDLRIMKIARFIVVLCIILIVPSLIWLIAGMFGLLPTGHLSIGASSGERTLASVAVGSCIVAAIACFKLEKESNK
tara:strand:+ start:3418 stop:3651 length:234 start_codon:yes stop_codon:yes gene_type:complete